MNQTIFNSMRMNSINSLSRKEPEDYLTPNSQSEEKNFQKYPSSNECKNWRYDEQKPGAMNQLKPVPLPGLTGTKPTSSPNGPTVLSQSSPINVNKRPPPPPMPPPRKPRPVPAISPLYPRESSNSCSSLSSTLTSHSAQSTNSSKEESIPDFVDIEPGLRNREWFHGKLTRQEAEELLIRLNKKGGFLIRYKQVRTQNIPYTLSVFCDKVYHLQIRYITTEYSYALGNEKVNEMTFKDLQTLVNHHKENSLQLIRIDNFSLSGSTKLTCSPKKQ